MKPVFTLEKKFFSFQKAFKEAKNGEIITLWEGWLDSWKFTPKGIYTRRGNEIFLNGRKCFKGKVDEWSASPKGLYVRTREREYFLNNKKITESEFSLRRYTFPQGVYNSDGNDIFLNKKKIFTKSWEDVWEPSLLGVCVHIKNEDRIILIVHK